MSVDQHRDKDRPELITYHLEQMAADDVCVCVCLHLYICLCIHIKRREFHISGFQVKFSDEFFSSFQIKC